jgi:hypothetical protein
MLIISQQYADATLAISGSISDLNTPCKHENNEKRCSLLT